MITDKPTLPGSLIQEKQQNKNDKRGATEMNEQIWNEAIFDGVEGADLERLNEAFNAGLLSRYEPVPNDLTEMTAARAVAHAHATRDAFLEETRETGGQA